MSASNFVEKEQSNSLPSQEGSVQNNTIIKAPGNAVEKGVQLQEELDQESSEQKLEKKNLIVEEERARLWRSMEEILRKWDEKKIDRVEEAKQEKERREAMMLKDDDGIFKPRKEKMN